MERAVTKIATIAAAALLVSLGGFAPTPSAAADATTEAASRQAAEACVAFNEYAPATVEQIAEDGLGDWIVWVRDKDSDLWLCNASSDGNVFANVSIRGDLLAGRGQQAMMLTQVSQASARVDEAKMSERLCAAAGRQVDATKIVATAEDGVGDYIVWLAAEDQSVLALQRFRRRQALRVPARSLSAEPEPHRPRPPLRLRLAETNEGAPLIRRAFV